MDKSYTKILRAMGYRGKRLGEINELLSQRTQITGIPDRIHEDGVAHYDSGQVAGMNRIDRRLEELGFDRERWSALAKSEVYGVAQLVDS